MGSGGGGGGGEGGGGVYLLEWNRGIVLGSSRGLAFHYFLVNIMVGQRENDIAGGSSGSKEDHKFT